MTEVSDLRSSRVSADDSEEIAECSKEAFKDGCSSTRNLSSVQEPGIKLDIVPSRDCSQRWIL